MCIFPCKDANVMLGCNLTLPVNNSYTGTVVVSSAFCAFTHRLTSISH
jgi:hypothetical protein